jgi:hypothetical protein
MCDEGLLNVVLPGVSNEAAKKQKTKNPKLLVKRIGQKKKCHHDKNEHLPYHQAGCGWADTPPRDAPEMATERWVVVVVVAVVVAVVVGDWDDCASVGGGSGARVHRRARREDCIALRVEFWRQAGKTTTQKGEDDEALW